MLNSATQRDITELSLSKDSPVCLYQEELEKIEPTQQALSLPTAPIGTLYHPSRSQTQSKHAPSAPPSLSISK